MQNSIKKETKRNSKNAVDGVFGPGFGTRLLEPLAARVATAIRSVAALRGGCLACGSAVGVPAVIRHKLAAFFGSSVNRVGKF